MLMTSKRERDGCICGLSWYFSKATVWKEEKKSLSRGAPSGVREREKEWARNENLKEKKIIDCALPVYVRKVQFYYVHLFNRAKCGRAFVKLFQT